MEIISNLLLIPHRDIDENPDNPRFITKADFEHLVDSICEFPEMLYKRPLVIVTNDNDRYMTLGGNMRLKAIPEAIKKLEELIFQDAANADFWRKNLELLKKGVPVNLADDWNSDQREEFIIKDNIAYGQHDWDVLANRFETAKLLHWGMKIPEVNNDPKEVEEDDFTGEPPAEPVTCIGDVYELNQHKVLCCDSTRSEEVLAFMGDDKSNLCFCSPPYWVGKSYETQRNENEIDQFIEKIASTLHFCTHVDNGRIVINTGTASINRIDRRRKVEILPLIDKWANFLKARGWLLRHLRIWMKRGQLPASISPKTDVIDQHNEYIACFEKEYSQILTFWDPDGEQRGQERLGTTWAQQGVWDDVHGQKSADGLHIAAFPVEIPFRNILLYTKKDEVVLDCFGGSGSTLIACEQLARRARIVELDPGWTDVIVQRWAKFMFDHSYPFEIKRNGQPFNVTIQ